MGCIIDGERAGEQRRALGSNGEWSVIYGFAGYSIKIDILLNSEILAYVKAFGQAMFPSAPM